MAPDEIFVLVLIILCAAGLTTLEVRSRRRQKANADGGGREG